MKALLYLLLVVSWAERPGVDQLGSERSAFLKNRHGAFEAKVAHMKVGDHFEVETASGWERAHLRSASPYVIHLASHGPQRVAPSLRVRPTSPASLAQRAARKNLSKGGQEALTEDVYKVTAEAIKKLKGELETDYRNVAKATGDFQQQRHGLSKGMDQLGHATEHLEAQIPEETLPRIKAIEKELLQASKEDNNEANGSQENAEDPKPQEENEEDVEENEKIREASDASRVPDDAPGEPTEENAEDPKPQEENEKDVEEKEKIREELPNAEILEPQFHETVKASDASRVPDDDTGEPTEDCSPEHVLGYKLQRGFYTTGLLAHQLSLPACAELCSKEPSCTGFSLTDGECRRSQGGVPEKSDLCIHAYLKVKKIAPKASAKHGKAFQTAPIMRSAPIRAKPKIVQPKSQTSIIKPSAHAAPEVQRGYCERTLRKQNAEEVRQELCTLLEQLSSLSLQSKKPVEKPKKVDQRYISEPTVGTDQEQFEDVARAQAAAWKKPDTAELIRDNFEQGYSGHLPGLLVLKLRDPWSWPNNTESLASPHGFPKYSLRNLPKSVTVVSTTAEPEPSQQSRVLERFLLKQPRLRTKNALDEATAMFRTAVDTAGRNVARFHDLDMDILRRLILKLDKKLEEVEQDPDFSGHQVVRSVHHRLPTLKQKVDHWSANPDALLQLLAAVEDASGGATGHRIKRIFGSQAA